MSASAKRKARVEGDEKREEGRVKERLQGIDVGR